MYEPARPATARPTSPRRKIDPFQQFTIRIPRRSGSSRPGHQLVPFGAFVRVEDSIEGLVHLSELAGPTLDKPEEAVEVGDSVAVVVTDIDL